jgi:hypothetical protein
MHRYDRQTGIHEIQHWLQISGMLFPAENA